MIFNCDRPPHVWEDCASGQVVWLPEPNESANTNNINCCKHFFPWQTMGVWGTILSSSLLFHFLNHIPPQLRSVFVIQKWPFDFSPKFFRCPRIFAHFLFSFLLPSPITEVRRNFPSWRPKMELSRVFATNLKCRHCSERMPNSRRLTFSLAFLLPKHRWMDFVWRSQCPRAIGAAHWMASAN